MWTIVSTNSAHLEVVRGKRLNIRDLEKMHRQCVVKMIHLQVQQKLSDVRTSLDIGIDISFGCSIGEARVCEELYRGNRIPVNS
jgi:hypothetical protein